MEIRLKVGGRRAGALMRFQLFHQTLASAFAFERAGDFSDVLPDESGLSDTISTRRPAHAPSAASTSLRQRHR